MLALEDALPEKDTPPHPIALSVRGGEGGAGITERHDCGRLPASGQRRRYLGDIGGRPPMSGGKMPVMIRICILTTSPGAAPLQ